MANTHAHLVAQAQNTDYGGMIDAEATSTSQSSNLVANQGAAIATADAASAVWFWGIIALLVIAAIGWLLYRTT